VSIVLCKNKIEMLNIKYNQLITNLFIVMYNIPHNVPIPSFLNHNINPSSISTECVYLEAFDQNGQSISYMKIDPYTNIQLRETPGLAQWVKNECEMAYSRANIFYDAIQHNKMYMGKYIYSYYMQVGTKRCDYIRDNVNSRIQFSESYVVDMNALEHELLTTKNTSYDNEKTGAMIGYDVV